MTDNKIVNIINILIFFGYVFLSIYETYIGEIVGNVTRSYLIVFLIFLFLNTRKRTLSANQLILVIWLLIYYISLLWTPNLKQASLYIGTVTAMTCTAILCENCYFSKNLMDKVVSMYKWSSVSMAFLGVFFSEPISLNNSTRMVLTLGGVQPDPNNIVALYAIGSGLSLFSLQKGNKYLFANIIGLFVCIYSILITGSRSGILILGIQFLIWFFYVHRKSNLIRKVLLMGMILAVTGYIIVSFISVDTIDRLFGKGDLAFTDSTGRDFLWTKALNLFYQSPLLGNGWGAAPAHNTFLTFLVDVGIIGTGLILIYLFRIFIRIIKYKDMGALAIFIPGIIQSFFIDAQNKRFFWNIIILSTLIINTYANTTFNTKNTSKIQG